MSSTWPRVALCMIVRDEEAVIERALRSAIPWITTWCIVDTGSTDGTKAIISRVMAEADISGVLYDRPWVSFGHNRTEALDLCKPHAEWAIMLDADDNLVGGPPPRELWDHLELDGMIMQLKHEQIYHNRIQIFRLDADWCYEGVVHEQPRCRGSQPPRVMMVPPVFMMETRCAGVRSRDPLKYLKDAALLEAEHLKNPTAARTLFYLAQSYRDADRKAEAIHYFQKYLSLGDVTERYVVYLNLILLTAEPSAQLALAWSAIELQPLRLEAGFAIMQKWRGAGIAPTQQLFALAASCTNRTLQSGWSYINPVIYASEYDNELGIVAFNTGHYKEAHKAFTRCAMGCANAELRERAVRNALVAKANIGGSSS